MKWEDEVEMGGWGRTLSEPKGRGEEIREGNQGTRKGTTFGM